MMGLGLNFFMPSHSYMDCFVDVLTLLICVPTPRNDGGTYELLWFLIFLLQALTAGALHAPTDVGRLGISVFSCHSHAGDQ